ncbi:DnaJ domain-containing protein [Acinetobacter qingfengensis]|uniref:DNA-binding protein n=1 Tax=Acinetobacter qingfengensis TaxID=1262585 RepID=A0A1E7R300_9GAMM|nr:DnaJ C-terminal domain-containing protein [Acinetobacter qingfengensis]KAA8733760.1 DnaJ domain-containing protein [Acinetobacter qingfengensis]OEY93728.1 DNA-binding protein [Acinetobacter qingfengensis]
MAENYYETLGIDRNATPEQIKKSYRKLARKYHPDISKEADAESKMQAINVAYDTLSHPEKKAEYDQMLDHPQGFAGFGQQGFNGQQSDGSQFYNNYQGNAGDFHDFEDLFGRFGAGFGGGTRRQRQSQNVQFPGEDQHAKIEVPLAVAYSGTTQQITLQIPSYNAHGEAEIQRKTLQIKIPKGMKEGQQIRLSGQGQSGINGGKNGDLYIEINYQETPQLYVEGADVYQQLNISPWEAALGGKVDINTPAGRLQVNLPTNAKNGQQLRLKDKGIPNTSGAGHLYLTMNICLPTVQTDTQKQAFQDLAKQFNDFNPRG